MAIIKIDADTLRSKATEIRTMKANHDENIARMRALVTNLSGVFEGEAATAYVNQFESMQATFTSFSEMIEMFAAELDTTANSFQEMDTTLASKLSV